MPWHPLLAASSRRSCGTNARTCCTRSYAAQDRRSIPPSQAVADDMDNTADNAPIVNTRHAMRQREIGLDAFELGVWAKNNRTWTGSPANLEEPKGEITMSKAFAINYGAHDGVMQSPGAFQ
jgi:hypothetical protein